MDSFGFLKEGVVKRLERTKSIAENKTAKQASKRNESN